MAEVAVNKNGTEVIGYDLIRSYKDENFRLCVQNGYMVDNTKLDSWAYVYDDPDEGCIDITIELPKGSIFKLTGKVLTWKDMPISLNENEE